MSIFMSNFMELSEWELLLNPIVTLSLNLSQSLSQSQLASLPLNNFILVVYTATLMFTQKASVAKTSLAFILCVFVGYTWVNVLAGWQLYFILSIIYGLTIVSIRQVKVMISCCIMMSFTIYMIFDEALYGADKTMLQEWVGTGKYKTWAWVHYELVTCFIHCLIISASIKWRPQLLRRGMEWLANLVRGVGHSLGLCSCV